MRRSASKKGGWSDHYTRRAKKEKYPARSVYKLQEIQNKFSVIKKGDRVLDLGCAPGSWLLYASQLTTARGRVTGIDLNPVTAHLPAHATVYKGDILNPDKELISAIGKGYRVVLSDMAPATTGQKDIDAARSYNLCISALDIAMAVLQPGGHFVCKIFQGSDYQSFLDSVRVVFKTTKTFKPGSSRKASKEIFVIGKCKKRN
jgi:23S rRNA (uridine2552-2'-O)-methyltransferase